LRQTPLEEKLTNELTPVIEHRGYQLVSLRMHGSILEIMAENPETRNLYWMLRA